METDEARSPETDQGSSVQHERARTRVPVAWALFVEWWRRHTSRDGRSLVWWLPWLALAVVSAWLVASRFPVVVLVAAGLLLAVLTPAALELFEKLRASERCCRVARRLEMPAAMLLLAWVIYVSLWAHLKQGIVIDTGDHQLMLARSRAIQQALAQGHVPKWSLAVQGGEPLTDLYPYVFDALIAPLKLFFAGADGYRRAYNVGVLALYWLRGVGGYCLVRRVASPWAALLVAAASLLDVGNAWDGTWSAALFWGMVHSSLSLTLCAFALAFQIDVARTGSTPRLALASLLGAMGMLAHPVGVVFLGVSTAALIIAAWLRRGTLRFAAWAGVAGLVAFALSAFWVIPYTDALREFGYISSAVGLQYGDAAAGLVDGVMPASSFAAYVGVATVGVAIALTAEDAVPVAVAIAALGLWTLTLTPLAVSSGFTDLYPEFLDGQPRRFNHGVKLVILPVVAWVLDRGYRLLREPRSLEVPAVLGRTVIATLLAAGFLRVAGNVIQNLQNNIRLQIPNSAEPGRQRAFAGPDHEKVFDWLRRERRADKGPTRWRLLVRYADGGPHMPHATWSEGFASGFAIVDMRYLSTAFLKNRPRELSAQALREWNIRYVLTDTPTPPVPQARSVFTSGPLVVWASPGYERRAVVAPSGVSISKLSVSDEKVTFRVSGAPAAGVDLRVRTAWFPRWTATNGGRRLVVTGAPPFAGAQPRQDQILIKRVNNGPVSLRCDGPLPRSRSSAGVSLVGLVLLGIVLPRRNRDRLSAFARRAADRARVWAGRWRQRRLWVGAALAALLLVCSVVWWRGSRKLRYPVVEGLGMSVSYLVEGKRVPCRNEWWLGRYVCGDVTLMAWGGYDDHTDQSGESSHQWPAILVRTATANAQLRFAFSRVDLRGGALELELQSSAGMDLQVRADGRLLVPSSSVRTTSTLPAPASDGNLPASASARAKAFLPLGVGKKRLRVPIAQSLRGTRELTLDFKLAAPASTLLFSGTRL